jgi:hypothetical protein
VADGDDGGAACSVEDAAAVGGDDVAALSAHRVRIMLAKISGKQGLGHKRRQRVTAGF